MSSMNVLVLAPMQSEADNFKSALSVYGHLANNYKVVQTGVGKVNMAATLSLELSSTDYDLIAVVGYAAGSFKFVQGDFIIPCAAQYHDIVCPFGFLPELESRYELCGNDDVVILTGDSFVNKELANHLVERFGCDVLFDMESTAAAQVLSEYSIPLLVMKIVSDIPQEGSNLQSFEEFCKTHTDFKQFVGYLESFASLRID